MSDQKQTQSTLPGILIGLGLGGLIDGTVLHQIMQWHNMGSSVLRPDTMAAMQQNMRWDGWFHVLALVFTITGIYLLVRDSRKGTTLPGLAVFTGQWIFGWGIFNLVEGIINHHILGIHHVRDMPNHDPFYDWLFLAVGGVGFIVLGWILMRRRRKPQSYI